MRIFLTGASGFLGQRIIKENAKSAKHKILGCANSHAEKGLVKLDITDANRVFKTVIDFSPDVVVHTAGFTGVDASESNKELAWKVNVQGTRNVATAARLSEAKLVFMSTDFVFDGKKGLYKEGDLPRPINYYGHTKLLAEQEAMKCERFVIARTSVIYGWSGHKDNFAQWLYKNLKEGQKLRVFSDQFNSPTFVGDLAKAVLLLCEKGYRGVYHAAGSERISRLDFALALSEVFGFDKKLVAPTKSSEQRRAAKRPADSSLDISKISRVCKMSGVFHGLLKAKEELK